MEFPLFLKVKKLNKMKKGLLGIMASMIGLSAASAQNDYLEFKPRPKMSDFYSTKMPKGCRSSEPSEYFGRRSEIVTAYTKSGTKQMKLKNALKGNHEFDFITK